MGKFFAHADFCLSSKETLIKNGCPALSVFKYTSSHGAPNRVVRTAKTPIIDQNRAKNRQSAIRPPHTEDQSDGNENATNKKTLTKINYDRIKTIFVIRMRNLTVGGKPINAPYNALVSNPSQKEARVV